MTTSCREVVDQNAHCFLDIFGHHSPFVWCVVLVFFDVHGRACLRVIPDIVFFSSSQGLLPCVLV